MLNKIIIHIKNFIFSLLSRKTIGSRALVIREDEILLVTHTYIPGWYSIGGGVERGESPIKAIKRELIEEVGVNLLKSPKLFNIYHKKLGKHDDYIVFYICKDFIEEDYKQDKEIKEKRWFKLNDLPVDISPATKRRIDEYLGMADLNDKY